MGADCDTRCILCGSWEIDTSPERLSYGLRAGLGLLPSLCLPSLHDLESWRSDTLRLAGLSANELVVSDVQSPK